MQLEPGDADDALVDRGHEKRLEIVRHAIHRERTGAQHGADGGQILAPSRSDRHVAIPPDSCVVETTMRQSPASRTSS